MLQCIDHHQCHRYHHHRHRRDEQRRHATYMIRCFNTRFDNAATKRGEPTKRTTDDRPSSSSSLSLSLPLVSRELFYAMSNVNTRCPAMLSVALRVRIARELHTQTDELASQPANQRRRKRRINVVEFNRAGSIRAILCPPVGRAEQRK